MTPVDVPEDGAHRSTTSAITAQRLQSSALVGDSGLTDSDIARSASRGALASVSRTGAVLALQTLSSLAIAHLIAPGSYGIFGLALVAIGFVRYVGDLGTTYRLEVLREITEHDRARALAVGLATSAAGALVVSVAWQFLPLVQSGPAGSRLVAPALAATLLVTAPANTAAVILYRRLAFRTVANAGLVSTVALFAIQLPLLLAGLGIWAMVAGYATAAAVNVVYLIVAAGGVPRPRIPERLTSLLRAAIPYQAPLLAQAAVGLIVSAIVAGLLGARGVGFFAWSTTLTTPILTVIFALEGIVAPSLARMLRDDGSRYSEATDTVVATFGVLAAASAGAVVGIVPSVVHFIFGVRWMPAVGTVQIAVAGVIPMSLVAAWASIVNSQARPGRRLAASVAAGACALVCTVPLTLAAGITGAGCVAYVLSPLVEVVVLSAFAWRELKAVALRVSRLVLPLAAVSFVLERWVTSPTTLAIAAAISGIACCTLLVITERTLMATLWRAVR